MSTIKDRLGGLFWGQLTGDALGTRYEIERSENVNAMINRDLLNHKGTSILPILGGGPFGVKSGQYTDDSELALGLWDSLLISKSINLEGISNAFYSWYLSDPFDIGSTTRFALDGGYDYTIMKSNAAKHCMTSLSNGCLMKISPLGAAAVLKLCSVDELPNIAEKVCELTNPSPMCIDICKAYVMAIHTALTTGDPIKTFTTAYNTAQMGITKKILIDAIDLNTSTRLPTGDTIPPDRSHMGYVGIAFQNAFYQLLKSRKNNTFGNAMIDTISLGGDTDTNACIAGALYGACFGMASIPTSWVDTIKSFDNPRKNKYSPLDHNKIYASICQRVNKFY